ncbi:bifunctional 5,10-methylenetetrahydrofolate dehydrogenase/5,10-methenyltetrahydrofolate cyclohydrolase [Haploplasma modicum]|uniref:bifunctional 5,10-methylenetetrahydrofolate dehydrogenase/5,10-methenyltetrahydrofolate cyclohydrolase n=1 Tax=Haploplasma modicum TaxID=2150 RepID=UPI00214BD8FF|nr:bifunctional 5,10-methylenetetrahydrofolate dehydrogenase/5,10-methenyltetrahydrofolate cyclohydrolase [Haploplasma modicum]MCR1808671.1 bifunctional 5,10-methylenetetrahydrofolate dehydrogenase/5,10-methenyltetrahydrofolate cyclohydrolase [Haploplasma modicum]
MLLDGLLISKKRNEELKTKIKNENLKLKTSIILVGEDPASLVYVKGKIKASKEVGIETELINLSNNIKESELELLIKRLNNDSSVNGILLQLPLPKGFNEKKMINLIDPNKDIDGFTTINQGKLFQKLDCINAATPQGIINLIDEYKIDVSGMNVVVIGRSQIVGLPIAKLLLDRNASVTICHSKTKDIKLYTKEADLVVVAVGIAKLLKEDMVKDGVIVIDVGINRIDGKLIGDVDFENVSKKASYITPVPRGVGPMTINALLENVYKISKMERD